MDKIKNIAKKLEGLRISPKNDSFEEFEKYAREKRKKTKSVSLWICSIAATLLLFLAINGIARHSIYSINDFCEDNACLCEKSFADLQEKGYNFKEVIVNNDCIENCSTCDIGRWYTSNELRGVILQKSIDGNEIFRIRLTKDYKGKLPNGKYIKLSEVQLEDLKEILQTEMWYADKCSDYASFSQGNFRVLVKSYSPIKSGFISIDNNNLSKITIEAIEIFNSCKNN